MGIWDVPPSPNFVFLVSSAQGISTDEAKKLIIDTQCPPSTAALTIKAKAAELKTSWVTTGFYTGEEMFRAVGALLECSKQAMIVADRAYELGGSEDVVAARAKFHSTYTGKIIDLQADARKATATGAIIDAPAFKTFAVSYMNATYDLMRKAEYEVCMAPWWASALATVVGLVRAVFDVLMAIGKVLVKAGQELVKVGFGLIGMLPYIIRWGGLGLGLVFVSVFTYNKLVATAESGRFRVRKFSKPVAGYRRR
jgi:hypothetical protein